MFLLSLEELLWLSDLWVTCKWRYIYRSVMDSVPDLPHTCILGQIRCSWVHDCVFILVTFWYVCVYLGLFKCVSTLVYQHMLCHVFNVCIAVTVVCWSANVFDQILFRFFVYLGPKMIRTCIFGTTGNVFFNVFTFFLLNNVCNWFELKKNCLAFRRGTVLLLKWQFAIFLLQYLTIKTYQTCKLSFMLMIFLLASSKVLSK